MGDESEPLGLDDDELETQMERTSEIMRRTGLDSMTATLLAAKNGPQRRKGDANGLDFRLD